LAVADIAGGDWSRLARQTAVEISGDDYDALSIPTHSIPHALLSSKTWRIYMTINSLQPQTNSDFIFFT
jgi:hypothetical protein